MKLIIKKLVIKRDQKAQTVSPGNTKVCLFFLLSYRVELTPEEQALVAKYRAEDYPLTYTMKQDIKIPKDTISTLTQGVVEELEDIKILLNNEEVVKDTCKNFKTLLKVMASSGSEEVFEF